MLPWQQFAVVTFYAFLLKLSLISEDVVDQYNFGGVLAFFSHLYFRTWFYKYNSCIVAVNINLCQFIPCMLYILFHQCCMFNPYAESQLCLYLDKYQRCSKFIGCWIWQFKLNFKQFEFNGNHVIKCKHVFCNFIQGEKLSVLISHNSKQVSWYTDIF